MVSNIDKNNNIPHDQEKKASTQNPTKKTLARHRRFTWDITVDKLNLKKEQRSKKSQKVFNCCKIC